MWVAALLAATPVLVGGVGCETSNAETRADESEPPSATDSEATSPQENPLKQRTKGSDDAPITVVEMSDFQCPFCQQFATQTLPDLIAEYIETGKVRFIFVNLPLTQLHPNAVAAHEVAMCAARQDSFWPMHDIIFRQQDQWAPLRDPRPTLLAYGDSVGLDQAVLAECVTSGATRTEIQAEVQTMLRAGARSTPTFIINGATLEGAAPIDSWRSVLDSILTTTTSTP